MKNIALLFLYTSFVMPFLSAPAQTASLDEKNFSTFKSMWRHQHMDNCFQNGSAENAQIEKLFDVTKKIQELYVAGGWLNEVETKKFVNATENVLTLMPQECRPVIYSLVKMIENTVDSVSMHPRQQYSVPFLQDTLGFLQVHKTSLCMVGAFWWIHFVQNLKQYDRKDLNACTLAKAATVGAFQNILKNTVSSGSAVLSFGKNMCDSIKTALPTLFQKNKNLKPLELDACDFLHLKDVTKVNTNLKLLELGACDSLDPKGETKVDKKNPPKRERIPTRSVTKQRAQLA